MTASPDGRFLVDVKPGPMANKITVLDLEFTRDGARLVLVGDGGLSLVDTATWTALPVQLIVDGFSHAPRALLSQPPQMGLSLTGYRAGEEE